MFSSAFRRRDDGLLGLQKTYDFNVERRYIRPMDIQLAYIALAYGDHDVDVRSGHGRADRGHDLLLLEDDKDFFPNYALTPVVREDPGRSAGVQGDPGIGSTRLDDSVMQLLNGHA